MNAPLRIHNLTVTHRGHPAVHHLSGEFAPGLLTAVVGPNGAGKSSLMSVLAGTRRDFEGRLDRPPAQQVAYLPQAASLDRSVPVTVHEVVAMGLWPRLGSFRGLDSDGRAAVSHALAAVGLSGFERRLIGELSAGQTQRVLFARVLVQDAQLILLDEPFNAIDARTTAGILQQPLLVIHDEQDEDVPAADGAAIARAASYATLVLTEGLGHRGVMRDPGIVARAVAFLEANVAR